MGAMKNFDAKQRAYEWSQGRAHMRKLDEQDVAEAEFEALQAEADEERELEEFEDVEED